MAIYDVIIIVELLYSATSRRRIHTPLQQEYILFCAGETWVISNCSDLFQSHMLQSCQFLVRVPYFAQVSTTLIVYSVTNFKSNGKKNG